jgi:superfamily II DNA or RNA helicase
MLRPATSRLWIRHSRHVPERQVLRDLVADEARTRQVADDVSEALRRGHCLVLTKWVAHLDQLAYALRERGKDPVVLHGEMGAKARQSALARLDPQPGSPPLLVVATGPYIGEGFDCPALDTLFLAAPVGYKGSVVQWAGRILRAYTADPPADDEADSCASRATGQPSEQPSPAD